ELGEPLQQLALLAAEVGRRLDQEPDVLISAAAAVEVGNPLAADADHLPALRAGGDLELVPTPPGGGVALRAQGRLGEGDGHPAEHLGVLADEDGVLLHVHHHVEVAGRASVLTRLALAHQPHPGTGIHPGGDLHREVGLRLVAAQSAAPRAGIGRRGPGAVAVGARAAHRAEALGVADLSCASTRRTGADLLVLAPGAFADLAALRLGNLDLHLGAECRLLEGDLQVVAEVGAAVAAPPTAAATTEDVPEDLAQDVVDAR